MRIWKKDEPFVAYEIRGSTETNSYVDAGWYLPSGSIFLGDPYGFPSVDATINRNNILKYRCKRCSGKSLVNKDKLPAIQALNCPNCGSSDMEEIE